MEHMLPKRLSKSYALFFFRRLKPANAAKPDNIKTPPAGNGTAETFTSPIAKEMLSPFAKVLVTNVPSVKPSRANVAPTNVS
jgi:hypothetical protein